jgi:hypothetical protein
MLFQKSLYPRSYCSNNLYDVCVHSVIAHASAEVRSIDGENICDA